MKKSVLLLGLCTLLTCSMVNAAQGQAAAKAQAACQNNPTQCANAKSMAKKERQAAKSACAKNQTACDNAKSKARGAAKA